MEVVPGAIRFAVPEGAKPLPGKDHIPQEEQGSQAAEESLSECVPIS